MPPIELSVDVVDGRFIKHLPGMLPEILRAAAYLNLGLCAVNLLPGIPLDGGKLLYLLVERRFKRANRTADRELARRGVRRGDRPAFHRHAARRLPGLGAADAARQLGGVPGAAGPEQLGCGGVQGFLNGLLRNFEPFSP